MKKENNFAREIAKYYMDFLKTGFKKSSRLPKRQVSALSLDGGLVGVNLRKYKEFLKDLRDKIREKTRYTVLENDNLYEISIPKNKYTSPQASKATIDRINEWVDEIVPKYIGEIQQIIKEEVSDYISNMNFYFSWGYSFSNKVQDIVIERLYETLLIKIREETEIEAAFEKTNEEYNPETILEYIRPLIKEKIDEITIVFKQEVVERLKELNKKKAEKNTQDSNTSTNSNNNNNEETTYATNSVQNQNASPDNNNNEDNPKQVATLTTFEEVVLAINDDQKYSKMIIESFSQEEIISSIKEALEKVLSSNDLFMDISQMTTSQNRKPNQAFYLYAGAIKIKYNRRNKWFPIIYMKIHVTRSTSKRYNIKFVNNNIYVNKAALEFVDKELRKIYDKPKRASLKNLDRIFKFNEAKSLEGNLNDIYEKVQEIFEIYFEKDLEKSKGKKSKVFEMRKKYFLWVFDQGDESLINDYEKVMEIGRLLNQFTSYISKYLSNKAAKNFIREVENKFDESPLSKKLLFKSPVPLNKEQRLVIEAIHTDGCNQIVVEGPPGTGKSHLITSIAFDSIINNKSCLILSDTKEALDVVEEKIEGEFEKIQDYEKNKNLLGILRIGKAGRNAFKIIKRKNMSALAKIADRQWIIKKNLDKVIQDATDNINSELQNHKKIDYKKIQTYLENFQDLSNNAPEELELLKQWFKNKDILNVGIVSIHNAIKSILDAGINLKYVPQHWIGNNFQVAKAIQNIKDFYSFINDEDRERIERVYTDLVNNINYADQFDWDFFSKWYKTMKDFEKNKYIKAGLALTLNSNGAELREQLKLIKFLNSFLEYWNAWNHGLKCNIKKWILNEDYKISSLENFITILKSVENLDSSNFPDNVPQEIRSILRHKGKWRKDDYDDFYAIIKAAVTFFKYVLNHNLDHYFIDEKLLKIFNNNINNFFPNFFTNPLWKIRKNWRAIIKDLEWLTDAQEKAAMLSVLNCTEKLTLATLNQKLMQFEQNRNNYINLQKNIEHFMKNIENLSFATRSSQYIEKRKAPSIYYFEIFNYFIDNPLQNVKDYSIFVDYRDYFEKLLLEYQKIKKVSNHLQFLLSLQKEYNEVLKTLGIKLGNSHLINLLWETQIHNIDKQVFEKYEKMSKAYYRLTEIFQDIYQPGQYKKDLKQIYKYTRELMFAILANKLYNFLDTSDFLSIRKKIINNQELTRQEILDLKKGFPCIIASIREYAEVIPLEENVFDLVIIDEASQVSTAQALTAIFRAKKIVILGDSNQFSNVSSSQADKALNATLIEKIQKQMPEKIGDLPINKEKIKSFDVRNSILKFLENSFNLTISLKNHFRSFPEIISYSNETYYNKNLNYLKLRDRPVKEIIKFDVLPKNKVKSLNAGRRKSNVAEAKVIVDKVQQLVKEGYKGSIGIITPHREQQRYIDKMVRQEKNYHELLKPPYNLKIMTFDTCQGEERDYIFYSMVERENTKTLAYVFYRYYDSDAEEISKGRQRLNVGFSRARNCMHFILSKEIDEFKDSGAIYWALLHFYKELEEAKGQEQAKSNSLLSENIIFNKMKKTIFYIQKAPRIEVQYKIGKYFESMCSTTKEEYKHPEYRDTLLAITKNKKRIMLEYDAFERSSTGIEQMNSDEAELQKRKVLESYGYKFLKLNRFILGNNPVSKLDKILSDVDE